MKTIVIMLLGILMISECPAEQWRLKLFSHDKAVICNVDGTDPEEASFQKFHGRLSPDGTLVAYVDTSDGDAEICVAQADGTKVRQLTKNDCLDNSPSWMPDGKGLLFASNRSGKWQVYSMDLNSERIKQLTDHKTGAWYPAVGPQGQITYLAKHEAQGKLRPVDLCIIRDGKHETLVEKTYITDYSWSPNGKKIAFGTVGKLVFRDLKTGQDTEVEFGKINDQLYSHAAYSIQWRPDSLAVTCGIYFLGGRLAGTKIFGDQEVFVIPTNGSATWFRPKQKTQRVEWVN